MSDEALQRQLLMAILMDGNCSSGWVTAQAIGQSDTNWLRLVWDPIMRRGYLKYGAAGGPWIVTQAGLDFIAAGEKHD